MAARQARRQESIAKVSGVVHRTAAYCSRNVAQPRPGSRGRAGLAADTGRVREALSNWLTPCIVGARCLDLFAGTGALGLEALSRGAREAVFVESRPRRSPPCVATSGSWTHARLGPRGRCPFIPRQGRATAIRRRIPRPAVCPTTPSAICVDCSTKGKSSRGGRGYLEQDRARELPGLPPRRSVLKNKTAGNVRYALAACAAEHERGEGVICRWTRCTRARSIRSRWDTRNSSACGQAVRHGDRRDRGEHRQQGAHVLGRRTSRDGLARRSRTSTMSR